MQKNIIEDGSKVNRFKSLSGLFTTTKNRLTAKKDTWFSRSLSSLPEYLADADPIQFEYGGSALYVKTCLKDEAGKKAGIWPVLDVESPTDHGSVRANIETAQSVFITLAEAGLTDGLHIMPTGTGFRFCWPFIIPQDYVKPFRAFLNDICGVDMGTLEPGKFTRLLAYRGHRNQDKKPYPDIHTHMLPASDNLFGLTPEEYQRMVKGRISKPDAQAWLDRIMPVNPMPRAWVDALEPAADRLRLKGSIIELPRASRPVGEWRALPSVLAYLDGRGISYQEIQTGGTTIYRLSECPECGRRDANPYVTMSGRLKHWTQSCRAGERGPDDRPIGLHPSKWVTGFEYAEPEPDQESENVTTIEDARAAITEAVNSDKSVIIRATPGVGKTTTSLIALGEKVSRRKVLWATPTNAKADETAEEAAKWIPGANIVRIRGRCAENCPKWEKCQRVAKKGFSPGHIVCPRCEDQKENTCEYYDQFKKKGPGLYVTSHAQAYYIAEDFGGDIIFDEDPTDYILQEAAVTLGEIMKFKAGAAPEIKATIDRIADAGLQVLEVLRDEGKAGGTLFHRKTPFKYRDKSAEVREWPTIWEVAKITDSERDMLSRHLAAWDQWADEKPGAYQRRIYRENLNLSALNWFLTALGEKDGVASFTVTKAFKDPYRFERRFKRLPTIKGRVVVLDGTAHKDALEALFERDFEEVSGEVPLTGCQYVHIRRGLGKTKCKDLNGKQVEKLLMKTSGHIKPSDNKILIATFKAVRELVVEVARKLWPDKQVDVIHFKGNRGLNSFKNHDACILFGTFTNNQTAAWRQAITLFSGEPDQAEYIRHLSVSENLQTVHRARPITGGKTIIVMGREWISGLPMPDVEHDLRHGKADQMTAAYDRAKMFYQAFGFLAKDMLWACGVCCKREVDNAESFYLAMPEVLRRLSASDTFSKKDEFSLIEDTLLGKTHQNFSKVVFAENHYYSKILKRLEAEFPGAGRMETKHGPTNGRWTAALGKIENVRDFAEALGGHFNPDEWRVAEAAPETSEPVTAAGILPDFKITESPEHWQRIRGRYGFPIKRCISHVYIGMPGLVNRIPTPASQPHRITSRNWKNAYEAEHR